MPIVCEHLEIDYDEKMLTSLSDSKAEIAKLPFRYLMENLLLEISLNDTTWIAKNYEYVKSLHKALRESEEYYDGKRKRGWALEYGAFPNQQNKPCMVSVLKRNKGIPEDLSCLYETVCDKNLKEILVKEDFADFEGFKNLTPSEVSEKIEKQLKKEEYQDKNVLTIIEKLDSGLWEKEWFPFISENKADLFFRIAVDGGNKDSIYSIMQIGDSDKLKDLADLAKSDDMESIIEEGRIALENKRKKEKESEIKGMMGKSVEKAITKFLQKELKLPADTLKLIDSQDGQDIIVLYKGQDIFRIEVKSRWSADQSVMMTPYQMETARENTGRYALCCVNMAGQSYSSDPTLEEIENRTTVLMNIGDLVKKIQVGNEEDVHISNYKCVVPQPVVEENGKNLEALKKGIVSIIKNGD